GEEMRHLSPREIQVVHARSPALAAAYSPLCDPDLAEAASPRHQIACLVASTNRLFTWPSYQVGHLLSRIIDAGTVKIKGTVSS
ncbi:MAG TPA: hypothetical protein VF875_16645, partial [Anaeromyxobacter sp.]